MIDREPTVDSLFRVDVISQTTNPQQLIYKALHQDYCADYVPLQTVPDETKCGEIAVRRLFKGKSFHGGCSEHPSISFGVGFFPHSVMQQARTHRIATFDVQSFRYTSDSILKVAMGETSVEDAFYLRPVGNYTDRQGKKYHYSYGKRISDINWCYEAAKNYKADIEAGISEEHARGKLPFDYRQHFIVSFNCRSLMHFLDLRFKKDAQLEIQQMCELIYPHFEAWVPQIAEWYTANRKGKALLAP